MRDANRRFDLSGKVALVTGGSRGMGKEMVLAFAQAGADVVIASRKLDSCEALAEQVRKETGRRALPVACNVGDWTQNEKLAETALAQFGRVDVLVNNAGMSPLYDHVVNVTEALWDKVIGIEPEGPVPTDRAVGHADGRTRRRLDRHRLQHRLRSSPTGGIIPYAAAKAAAERDDGRLRARASGPRCA